MRHKHISLLAALCSLVAPISAQNFAGTVFVKLDYYRQQDRRGCDGVNGWSDSTAYTDYCDPFFTIWVGSAIQQNSLVSTVYDNAPTTIHFGNSIGQLPNPLQFPFAESLFHANDQIEVSIVVKDRNPHDVDKSMANFRMDSSIRNVITYANYTFDEGSIRHLEIQSAGHRLRLAVWIRCSRNYYQAGCSVHCDPERFNCNATGAPICPSGHLALNGSCSSADKCMLLGPSYCQNGGTCVTTLPGEAVCRCSERFTGPQCQVATHPCHRDASRCARGVCRKVSTDSESSECVCDGGFAGINCDEDVDECGQPKSSPCGIGGDCTNTVGSFRCNCRPGFSGSLCRELLTLPGVHSTTTGTTAGRSSHHSATTGITGKSSLATDQQISSLSNAATQTFLLVLLLIVVICALAAVTIVYIIQKSRRASNYSVNVPDVAYRTNEPGSVSIEQPDLRLESTYYEEVDDAAEAVTVGVPVSTGNFNNAAYSHHADSSVTVTCQSRSFSKKPQASQPANQQPDPPPRASTNGLDTYLVPIELKS